MKKRGARPKRGEVVWSPELAYSVGLMVTDGCLSSDGRHLDLTSKDTEQLRNFMQGIGREVRIGKKKTREGQYVSRIQFSDVGLYGFLLSIGLTPKKTHTIGSLRIPKKFFLIFCEVTTMEMGLSTVILTLAGRTVSCFI